MLPMQTKSILMGDSIFISICLSEFFCPNTPAEIRGCPTRLVAGIVPTSVSAILKISGPISIDLCGMPMISIDLALLFERLGPYSGRMINAQNLDLLPLDTIQNDLRHAVNNEFARTPHSSLMHRHVGGPDCTAAVRRVAVLMLHRLMQRVSIPQD